MRAFVRPDGRCFVRDPDAESLAGVVGDVYCAVDEADVAPYLALGFVVHRREGTYLVPTRAGTVGPPAGLRFAPADEVDETCLRLLDTLHERGVFEVSTEIDETNVASRSLLEGIGARRTGTSLELIRRYGLG